MRMYRIIGRTALATWILLSLLVATGCTDGEPAPPPGDGGVRALMSHLYDELGAEADLYAGRTRSPDAVNLMPRAG